MKMVLFVSPSLLKAPTHPRPILRFVSRLVSKIPSAPAAPTVVSAAFASRLRSLIVLVLRMAEHVRPPEWTAFVSQIQRAVIFSVSQVAPMARSVTKMARFANPFSLKVVEPTRFVSLRV
jgi:hypothetical protein